MQERRLTKIEKERAPSGDKIEVPKLYWEDLSKKDLSSLCLMSGATQYKDEGVILSYLNRDILINIEKKNIYCLKEGKLTKIEDSMLELMCLVYLLNVGTTNIYNDLITVKELKESHFFRGPHEIDTAPLERKFGYDVDSFRKVTEFLGGSRIDMADTACRLDVFPKVPVYLLLWEGDDEFEPRFSILFDRSVEKHLSADAIWGIVKLVSNALLEPL